MNYSAKKAREVTRMGTRITCSAHEGGHLRGTVRKATGLARFDVVTVVFDDRRYHDKDGKRDLYVGALMLCLVR